MIFGGSGSKVHATTQPDCWCCRQYASTRANVSQEDAYQDFKNFERVLNGVPPENIFNFDETNFKDDPGNKKVMTTQPNIFNNPKMKSEHFIF